SSGIGCFGGSRAIGPPGWPVHPGSRRNSHDARSDRRRFGAAQSQPARRFVTVIGVSMSKPMTLTQKILAPHARGLRRPRVQAGDVLEVRVDWTLASELAWNGMDRTYEALGRPPLDNANRFFLAIDHTVDPVTLSSDARTQALVEKSRRFAKERGVRHFY